VEGCNRVHMAMKVSRRGVLRGAAVMTAVGAAQQVLTHVPRRRETAAEEERLSIALLDVHAERMESLFEEYAEETGIDLEITPLGYEELYTQLSLALTQRSSSFDVVSLDDCWIPQFSSFLTPLDVDSDAWEQNVPVVNEVASYPSDSPPCGIPWLGDVQFFVSRSQWLDRLDLSVPSSWDEVLASADVIDDSLESKASNSGFAISTLRAHDVVDSFLPILRGCGVDLIDQETSVPQLDTAEAIVAATTFERLSEVSPVESRASGEPTNADRFGAGEIAMMANFWTSNLLSGAGTPAADLGPIDCSLQPYSGNGQRLTMPSVWIAAIPTGSERVGLASALVAWLTSIDVQRRLVDVSLPPVVASVYGDDALIDWQPHLPRMLELISVSKPRPRSPYYSQLEQLLAAELGLLLSGEQSAEEAMRQANVAMREFLGREGVLVS
jgi:multiple sugar transport system substrate-binding protein